MRSGPSWRPGWTGCTGRRISWSDAEAAEDAVQNALLRAWRDLGTLRDPERFDAWLARIVSRAALDEARRRRRWSLAPHVPWLREGRAETSSIDERERLARAFGLLTPEHRLVLALRFYLDLGLPEIAEATGVPLGTVKSRLHYDGRQRAEWLTASGTFFEGPLGQAYDGPAEVSLANGASTGRFYADRLVLLPTFPALQPATTRGPVPSSDGGPVLVAIDAPFAGGQLLHCIGAEAMTPQQVFLYARARGYPVEYRYERDSYSSNEEPPAGSVLTGASWGSQGQLLVFASPPDAPSVDQMRLTADRACPAAAPSK